MKIVRKRRFHRRRRPRILRSLLFYSSVVDNTLFQWRGKRYFPIPKKGGVTKRLAIRNLLLLLAFEHIPAVHHFKNEKGKLGQFNFRRAFWDYY